jgi:LCP family protein required for cell wall assembly
MDNFQRKQRNMRRPTTSIDGVSRSAAAKEGRAAGAGSIGFNKSRTSSYQPTGQMDNFSKSDGLHASSESTALRPTRSKRFSKPDIPGVKYRRRFGLFGKKVQKKQHKHPRLHKFFKAVAILVILILLVGGFLVAKGYINVHKVLRGGGSAAALDANVDPSRLNGEGDGRVNILLMGRGGEGHDGADLTDTMILVSIDPIAKQAALVSIPRDLYVTIPGRGTMKINAAFSTGKMAVLNKAPKITNEVKQQADNAGFDLADQTVSSVLGVPVHYHAMVDFSGFKQAVDTVGGIDLNAPEAVREMMYIDGKNYLLDVKPGQQHMDGFKALAYSRSRHTSARGDFDRSERQRLMIVALKEKIFSLGTFSNPSKISQLLGTFGSHVQTDFSVQDLSRLYTISKDINGSNVTSIGLADPPNNYLTTGNINGLSVVIPTAGQGNYTAIQSYIRNTLRDSFLKSENATVAVFNGTTTGGLATTKADELKSYGYTIGTVDNAPTKNYTKTVVVDLRNGSKKYTKNYLEKRFGVTAVTSLPDPTIPASNADFVIILGSDQVSTR